MEGKFKKGDWVTTDNQYVTQIASVEEDGYCTIYQGFIPFVDEKYWHLWNIQDAKDGDVLANDNEIIIFKENNFNQKDLSGCMFVHCSLHSKKGYWYTIGGINPSNYVPATKEQRNLLFRKMNEVGYEWDAENKELKKTQRRISAEAKEALYDSSLFGEDEKECDTLEDKINELHERYPEISFAKLSRICVSVSKWQKKKIFEDLKKIEL